MMADVSLFGGRGGASRGGVVSRPARGGARNRVPQPIANVLWTLLTLVKIIYTLQINWVLTTAQRGILFGSGCKTVESKL